MRRRAFLLGLSAVAAPAIIHTPGLLMPVKQIVWPNENGPFVELDTKLPYGRGWRVKNFTLTFYNGETLYWPEATLRFGTALAR